MQDLLHLVSQIVPYHMTHNAEPEAVDLLLEVCYGGPVLQGGLTMPATACHCHLLLLPATCCYCMYAFQYLCLGMHALHVLHVKLS